jgi:hypothetical protein
MIWVSLDADTADHLLLGGARLIFQEEIVLEKKEIRENDEISLAQVDKDIDLKDRVWIQMNQLNFVIVKKVAKEFAGCEAKPTLKEGGENNDLIGIGCRNVFVFRRPPLEDDTGGAKMILDEFEELALIDG